jgi:hypothetical protein
MLVFLKAETYKQTHTANKVNVFKWYNVAKWTKLYSPRLSGPLQKRAVLSDDKFNLNLQSQKCVINRTEDDSRSFYVLWTQQLNRGLPNSVLRSVLWRSLSERVQ